MNNSLLTTHTSLSFWDGLQKTQLAATHAAEHTLTQECAFHRRMYAKRDTHVIVLSVCTRVLIQNQSSVPIVVAPLGISVPANDFFYAMLPADNYELQLSVNEDHKFSVTTITE